MTDPTERCLELFALHQRRLSLYISALVPSPADADEILQETNVVIWKKFDTFTPGTDFLSWACRIALYQVLDYRRRQARSPALLSEEVTRQVAEAAGREGDALERRRAALQECRGKLAPAERKLLDECYRPGTQIPDVARRLKRVPTSLYRTLRRIRQALMDCIDRRLASE